MDAFFGRFDNKIGLSIDLAPEFDLFVVIGGLSFVDPKHSWT